MTLPPTWTMFGADHLPHRLLLLAKILDREIARQLQQGFGLSLAEWRVLAFVCAAGPASAAEVGAAFESDRAEVSRAVGRLVENGLVERTADEAHRKRMIITPTALGHSTFEDARRGRRAYFLALMEDLSTDERATLDRMLERLALRMTALRQEPAV